LLCFNTKNLSIGETLSLWLNSYCAEKEKAEEVYRYQRGEGRVASCAGDASAGEARGEQEARKKRQAQTEPEQAAGGC
jgi:hypothetical protein